MAAIWCVLMYIVGALTGAIVLKCYEDEQDKRRGR